MKRINYIVRPLYIVLILQAFSCEKMIEYLPEEPEECRIKSIHFFDGSSEYIGNFFYNNWGDPDSVIFGFVGTGFPNLHFKYNNRRQLTQAKFVYSNGEYETWHKFGYTNGQITTDTVYVWGSDEEPEPEFYYSKNINHYKYDSAGRIIMLILDQVSPDYPPTELTYAYDANGNLIYGGDIPYDNYVNIHVLHPIWQFFAEDYSLNNPIAAKAYNSFRLPLEFDNSSPGWEFPTHNFFGRSLNKSVIEYDCQRALYLTKQ